MSLNINKYRDLCRKLIRQTKHKLLTPARKDILLALVDGINDKEGYTAWPSFDALAATTGYDRQTAIKAVNAGRKVGILERIYKGGLWKRGGTSNRYGFPIDPVSGEILGQRINLVSGETTTRYPARPRPSIPRDTQSSNYHLKNNLRAPTSSSGLEGHSSVVASEDSICLKEESESGERGPAAPKSEPSYLEIKKALNGHWPNFSPGSVNRHMRIYGAAKTLEVIECAARLGRPDINKLLGTPLMEWSAPVLEEIEYSPETVIAAASQLAPMHCDPN